MADNRNRFVAGSVYHIFNRTNGKEKMFEQEEDYKKFLFLIQRFVMSVADLLSWSLIPNHFHLLVRIKHNVIYKHSKNNFQSRPLEWEQVKWETVEMNSGLETILDKVRPSPGKHIAHLCSTYAKYFNARYHRHGALFQRPFKSKLIESEDYQRKVILYVHCNAVHHEMVKSPDAYPWSFYHDYLRGKSELLKQQEIIELFGGLDNFIEMHKDYSASHYSGDLFLE